ncbi:hypothetical protein PIB30_015442 [Stylosanthes scabra]|uniref:Transcription repressor n=1 Tax=Stylosanthes scabra TaxID=79078 RepID=A0ABU6U5U5_9FABA|nr:hypothetical protein [Stylosanthes scabra]
MKFLSLLKRKNIIRSLPSCHQQPRTLSFKDMFKTINSAFNIIIDEDNNNNHNNNGHHHHIIEEALSLFTDQSFEEYDDDATSFSTSSEDDPIEILIHELMMCSSLDDDNNNKKKNNNNRFFFELDETSSSIFEASKNKGPLFLKDSVVLSLDSNDPFLDFKKSMEEMVEALGLNKDWEGLQDLLSWYLKVNAKSNHGYIVGAFVDLLVGLQLPNNNNNNNNSYLSPNIISSLSPSSSLPNDLSCYSTFQSSSCSNSTTLCASNNSCLEGEGEGHDNHNHNSIVISHSSSLLLEQVKEDIVLHEDIIDEASSSSSRNV